MNPRTLCLQTTADPGQLQLGPAVFILTLCGLRADLKKSRQVPVVALIGPKPPANANQ